MKWQKKHINLGEIKVGVKKELIFIPTEELDEIDNMVSSCGCSVPKQVKNRIVVSFTPGSIPFHLVQRGFYKTTKDITITYKDKKQDKLSFSAIVKK